MKLLTIYLVTALVASSSATPWGSRANKQCAAYCKETNNFSYDVGTIYSYDYMAEVASKVAGTSDEESRLHISAVAEFEVVSQCEFILRMKRVNLEESDPTDASVRTVSAGSDEFAHTLQQHPLIFSFQDGQVEHLCPSTDEPVWALNIKRGVLSAMQNSMQDIAVPQTVYETDVVGHCETNYTVLNHGRSRVTVSRRKDLLACTGRSGQHSWSIPTTSYSSASPIQSLPLLRSDNECVQVIRNQRLEKSTCTETHLFRPFSNGQSGASTRIVQSLTYSQERRSDATPTDFKRTKSALIFDGSDSSASNVVASAETLKMVNELLEQLSQQTRTGIVSPQVPALFSQLVTALKSFSYRQLSELTRTHQTSSAYKYLTDAAPLLGTAASYQLMREIIDDGSLSDLEIDLWLTSLAFQTRPTLDMITVLSPMLDEDIVRPKALLSISALIHSYCRHRGHDICLSEPIVRQAITSIERRLNTSDQQTVILALKALGNAGLIVSSAETIKKFYMAEDKSMQIRLAAIESLRRVPCEADDRSSLLALYRDSGRDSELRIGAYLGAIRCPTQRLLDVVKQTLDAEPVNQVGSFVWTHLTNLQESQSPAKQAVRRLLASDTLRNKFQTDVRKFSRNFEASTFWPDTNVGGSVESNLIFSSRSYLPRSASLNLTVDLFGQSVNLLELGARLEGFEPLVESLFGPDGLYPDETLQKTLQSMRSERSSSASASSTASAVDQSLNQLMALFDAKSQIAEKPRGDVYVRIFGNELLVEHVHSGLLSKHSSPSALLALLMNAVRQGDIDFSKSVSLIDTSYVLPTVAGLPLSLSVNATATVSFGMGGTYRTAAGLSDLQVMGHVKPSASIDVNGLMTIAASSFARSGVRIQNAMHTATGMSGKIIVRGTQIVSVHLDAPQETSHVFSYDSQLFLLQTSRPNRPVPFSAAAQMDGGATTTYCSSNWLGVELCGRLEQRQSNNADGPRGLLAGPAHAALFFRKTDTHSSYVLDFKRDGLRSLSLTMDTPQSQVDRRVCIQFELDETAKTLKASFLASPLFGSTNTELTGRYEFNTLMKAVDVTLLRDSAQIASIRAALRTDLKGQMSGRIEPSLVVSKAGSDLLHFQGYYSYSSGSKYGFDFQLKHLTVRPIRFTGDISKDSEKYDASIGLKSYLLDTTVAGTIRRTDKITTCKAKTDYSVMEGTSHSVEVSTKFSRAHKGSLSKTAVSAVIQGSQYPQLDTDVSWELQTSEGYVENSARLSTGGDQWELHQLYKVQPGVVQLRAGIACRQQDVDLLAHVTLQSNQATEFSGLAGWQLSAQRKWSTKVDLTVQPQTPARYAANLELVSPVASRQFRSKVVQNERSNSQWDLLIEYSADQQVATSLTAVYKNLGREGIKLEHSVAAKLRSSMTQDLHLTALLAASPTGTQVGFSTTYGDRKSSGEVEYTRHSQLEHSINAQFARDDEVISKVSFMLNLAQQRRSLSVDIEAGRKITLDAFLAAATGEGLLSVFWDRNRDASRHLEISGQFLFSNGGNGKARAMLKCANLSPVRFEIDSFVNEYHQNMTALLEWQAGKAIIMELQTIQQQADGSKRFNGQLSTPFAALPLITLEGLHTATLSQLDSRWALDWQRDRLSFSLTGSRTAENVRGTFKMTSTVSPLLENAGLEFFAATSRPLHRYSLTVQHLGRQFELLAECRRRERFFSSASLRLATPIRGYELLSMSVSHMQRINSFESQVQLEGPLASSATVTLMAGRKVESHETDAKLSISTSFAALQTSSVSFRLINARSKEKKLKVEAEYNGQHLVVADAAADFSDAEQLRAQFRLDTAYTEQVTASIQHRHRPDGTMLLSQGRISWAGGLKSAFISLDGKLSVAGQTTLNVTLTTPGLTSNARLDHRQSVDGQVVTVVETEANGRKASWTLDAQSLSVDDLRFDCSMSVPYSGFENLRLGVEHRRPTLDGKSKAIITRAQVSKDRQRLSLQHDVEFRDAFNWANRLAIEQDSSASSPPLLVLTNKQTWSTSGQFQHETEIRFQDADKARFELNVDASKTGRVTSSGSIISTWKMTDNVSFLLEHTDDGLEFHPILTVSTVPKRGSAVDDVQPSPVRFEMTYRRGPNNPSVTTELSGSSSYPPVKLSAAFINADTPLKTVKLQLNWNSDRYVDWSLDWKLAMEKSHVATRLLTPFNGYSHVEGEISYDSTGPRKTALARLAGPNKPEQSLLRLEAFAAGQGSTYRSEVSLVADKYVQPIKLVAVLDLAGARASLQLDRNHNQLVRLQGVLSVAPTQTSVLASVETPVVGWRNVKVEGTLKANRELVVDLDADGRKVSLSASFSAGLGKATAKAAVKTTFNSLVVLFQSMSLDASYDTSNPSKTAQITVTRNENTMQASGLLTYIGSNGQGVKVGLNVKAPCCGIRHFEASGSYDESTAGRKTGHFKLDMNGEKYQLDGHVLNAAGHGELALKTLTDRLGYEQVSVSAKYDVRQSESRTADMAFSRNSDRFHLSAAANTRGPFKTDVSIDLTTPIQAYRSMRLDCRYDLGSQSSTSSEKTASIVFVRNGEAIRLSTTGSLQSPSQGKLDWTLETPFSGWQKLQGQLALDVSARTFVFVAHTIRAEVEWSSDRLVIRSNTPFSGFQVLNLNCAYELLLNQRQPQLRASLLLERNEQKAAFRLAAMVEPSGNGASFEIESPFIGYELLSASVKWNLQPQGPNSINVQAAKNTLTLAMNAEAVLSGNSSDVRVRATSNIEGWRSTALSVAYDLRSPISARLSLTREEPSQHNYALSIDVDNDAAVVLTIETPFEAYEKMSAKFTYQLDQSAPHQKTLFKVDCSRNEKSAELTASTLWALTGKDGEIEAIITFKSNWVDGWESATAKASYKSSPVTPNHFIVNCQLMTNGRSLIDATAVLHGLQMECQLHSPLLTAGFERLNLRAHVQLSDGTGRLIVERNGVALLETSGALTGRSVALHLQSAISGWEEMDVDGNWDEERRKIEFNFSCPSLVEKITVSGEYQPTLARLLVNHGSLRYRNELLINSQGEELGWRAAEVVLTLQLPVVEALRNVSSSLSYNLVRPAEKTMMITLDDSRHRYEATSRLNFSPDFVTAVQAVVHIQTPIAGFEEMDLSAGYDLPARTAFLASERNGKSILLLKAIAALSSSASNLSGTIRIPALLTRDLDVVAAYFVASDLSAADARFKLCQMEVLLDARRSDGWSSALATVATTFHQLRNARINWDHTDRTVALQLESSWTDTAIDARLPSWGDVEAAASVGDHTVKAAWKASDERLSGFIGYDNTAQMGRQMYAEFAVNYTRQQQDNEYNNVGDYLLTVQHQESKSDFKLTGHWSVDGQGKTISGRSAFFSNGASNIVVMETSFSGKFSKSQSAARLSLLAPSIISPVDIRMDYDAKARATMVEYDRLALNAHVQMGEVNNYRVNYTLAARSYYDYDSKVIYYSNPSGKERVFYSFCHPGDNISGRPMELIVQQDQDAKLHLIATVHPVKSRASVSASLTSSAGQLIGNPVKWNVRLQYDAQPSLFNSSALVSWAEDGGSIAADAQLSGTQLSATVTTPFDGYRRTHFVANHNFAHVDLAKRSIDCTLTYGDASQSIINVAADWEVSAHGHHLISVRLTTPFVEFEQVAVRGTMAATSAADFSSTLTFSRADQVVHQLKGQFAANTAGTTAKISFNGAAGQDLSVVIEYDLRSQKKTASLLVLDKEKRRFAISAAGQVPSSDKLNGVLTVESQSGNPVRIFIDFDASTSAEKSGRVTVEWGEQQRIELAAGYTPSNKVRLTLQTPFENLRKVSINGRVSPKAFDASFDYGRNRKVQLTGQYRIESSSSSSVYSINGTLQTPWIEPVSWQSFLDRSGGATTASASVNWADKKFVSVQTTYRSFASLLEVAIQSSHPLLRDAKLSSVYDLARQSNKRLALGGEYNGREASFDATFDGSRAASLRGTYNKRAVAVDALYHNDGNAVKIGTNVTTPFVGFERWSARLLAMKQISGSVRQNDFSIHAETPLAALPSLDASVRTVFEAGRRLEVDGSLSSHENNKNARLRFEVTKDSKMYTVGLELDAPLLESYGLRTLKSRAECQLDSWKNIAVSATAGIPSGDYSARASVLLGRSNININAGVKTPTISSRSIEMGAGYHTTDDLSLLQGELFLWDNKVEGRMEKRNNQVMVGEILINLPGIKLASTRLHGELNYRSARQLQASLGITQLQHTHTTSLSYQLSGSKFTANLDVESPLLVGSTNNRKSFSFKTNFGDRSALSFESKMDDHCQMVGSLRIASLGEGRVDGQVNLNCPYWKRTINLELASAGAKQGKLVVATGPSVDQQHQFAYQIDRLVEEGQLQVSISADSPAWIEPLYLQTMWQNGEGSLNVRYGRQSHSIRGNYLREGAGLGSKLTGSIVVASPYLPGSGEASLQMLYHQMEAWIHVDLLGQQHRIEGHVQNWPGLGARFALDSPALPWKSLVLVARAEHDHNTDTKINVTGSYGEIMNFGLAGRARYVAWNDMGGFLELTTPLSTLATARLEANVLAPNAHRINIIANLRTSHPSLPLASFNTQYHFTPTQVDASATLNTPFARWEEVGVKITVPLTLSSADAYTDTDEQNNKQTARLTVTMPSDTRYSAVASLHFPSSSRRLLDADVQLVCGSPERKFSARVLLKADDIYQARVEVTTPVRGFENYLWDLKGQADVKRWGESSAFLDWNGERIEFKSNLRAEPMAYVAVVQLKTPIAGFERYGLRVRLEGTERKSLTLELESPLWKAGADFDYHLNSATDFVGKASIRTPLIGYESFTLHLSNQLVTANAGTSSLSLNANAEARFAHMGLASNVEVVVSRNGVFRLSADGRYNEQTASLKTKGRLDERGLSCTMNLTTPFSRLANMDAFVQFERDLSSSRGLGLSVNGHEKIQVSLVHQSEMGHWLLSINNPWRPVDLAFSWQDESSDLIHYHAQLCWDLQRRSRSTLGARLVVNTTSYGRQVNIETVTPRRRVSFDYNLQLTSTKLDHSIALSWAPERKTGYRIYAEDRSTLTLINRHRSQLSGSVRLDLPARSFQLEMDATKSQESATSSIVVLWDASRDVTRRIGARLETETTNKQRQGGQVRLIFLHPSALEQDIVLTAKYGDLSGVIELVYSSQPEHRFLLQGSVIKVANGRQILISVVHPVSHTDMRLQANATRLRRNPLQPGAGSDGIELAGRLDYSDRSSNARFLQLGARIEPEQRCLSIELRTADGAMKMTNALSVDAGGYGIASRTIINDVDALTVDGHLASSLVQLDAHYAGGKAFNFYAGMPDRRQLAMHASRDIYGRKITDGLLQLRLNNTNLLSSRMHWRGSSVVELRHTLVNGLIQVLTTAQLIINDVNDFAVQEWADKRSSLAPAGRLLAQRLADNMNSQLVQFGSEFNALADEWAAMYEQNDFYMRDVLSAAGQVASLARPFVERSLSSIGAVARALSVESVTFYRSAHGAFGSLASAASSAYLQATSYVYGAVKETVRNYNHLTAQVMERLLKCEAALGRFIEQVKIAYLQMAGRLEEIVMQRVEELRNRFVELATSYADKFQPWTKYLNDTVDSARVYYRIVIRSIQDWRQMIHERLLTYAPFQRLYSLYRLYSTWLEEFHFQDYVDQYTIYLNQLKVEMSERFQSIASRYQPLIEPVISAFDGQMESLKQMPVVMYVTKVIERLSLQIGEFSKYIELEAQLRLILRQALQQTDRLVKQLAEDLKGSLNVPGKPTVELDWNAGRLEWSQRLPFTWETFDTMPRFRELPLLRGIAKARRNLLREMDYSQIYFSIMNAFATYQPLRLRTIVPPFGSHAFIAGTQHYMTFDGRHYDFAGECSYLLVSDFFRNDFSVVVNYESVKGSSKVTRKSLTILSDGRKVEVDSSSFRVTVNGRKIEMPLSYEGTHIWRDGQRVLVSNERGYRIDCNLYRDTCSVHVPGWSFGKTGGLFGVFNNEPADDFLTPFRQQRSDDEIDSFASSWKVGTARCRVRNYATTVAHSEISHSKTSVTSSASSSSNICDPLFADGQSVLRPCFQVIDPAPYARMCLNDLAALANSAKKDLGACTAAAAYVNECRLAGLDLFMPPQCVRCELENGQVMGSGEMRTLQQTEVPRSADVVFIVEQKPCVNGTRLSNLPVAIDSALREMGIEQNRFAVVGFGGRGMLLNRPHIRTAEGQIWANRIKSIQLALEDMPLDWTAAGGNSNSNSKDQTSSDIHAALRYAVNLPYRVGVSKQFVLVSCAGSECQASSYADTLTLLIENDIKLHLLQPRDLVVKGRNSSEEIKNVFGIDAEEVFTARNVRSLKGDRELRRQLSIPKDFCTPLALETNGTLFDLKKMMLLSSDVAGPTSLQAKKFIDIFARRVAATGEPSPCQRCDCIGDRDGIGAVLCQRCVSPVLERLDKVWEQLVYENELENEPENVQEVSVVAEISRTPIEKPTSSAKKNTTTVTNQATISQ